MQKEKNYLGKAIQIQQKLYKVFQHRYLIKNLNFSMLNQVILKNLQKFLKQFMQKEKNYLAKTIQIQYKLYKVFQYRYLFKYLIFSIVDQVMIKNLQKFLKKFMQKEKNYLGKTIQIQYKLYKVFQHRYIFKYLNFQYGRLGDYKKYLEINEKVYAKRKELLGENHPDTIQTL